MAIIWADSFGHQSNNLGGLTNKLYTSSGGTVTFDTSVKRNASYSPCSLAVDATTEYVQKENLSLANVTFHFFVRFASVAFTTATDVAAWASTSGGANGQVQINNSTGKFQLVFAASSTDFGPASLSADTWYRVDVSIDVDTTNNLVAKATIDGANEGSITLNSATATTIAYIRMGTSGTGPVSGTSEYYADWVITDDLTNYPLNGGDDYYVETLVPTGDGTHSTGSGAFRDLLGNVIDNTTTDAYTHIDHDVDDTSDYIVQNASDATAYVECTFGDLQGPAADSVECVIGVANSRDSASTGSNFGATSRLVESDGTLMGNMRTNHDPGSSQRVECTTVLTGYTKDDVNGMRLRLGFSNQGSPDPRFGSVVAMVLRFAVETTTSQFMAVVTAT